MTYVSHHLEGCSADEDPDGATMCVCASLEVLCEACERGACGPHRKNCCSCPCGHDPYEHTDY